MNWPLVKMGDDMTYGFDELFGHTAFDDYIAAPASNNIFSMGLSS